MQLRYFVFLFSSTIVFLIIAGILLTITGNQHFTSVLLGISGVALLNTKKLTQFFEDELEIEKAKYKWFYLAILLGTVVFYNLISI